MASWQEMSYETLPALSLRGSQLRKTLRRIIIAWCFGIIWMTVVMGSRMTVFCRMVGFSDFHFGLLAGIPFLATGMQIFATILIERTGMRKHQFIIFHTIHRALWLVVAAIPLILPIPSLVATWALLAIVMISHSASAVAIVAWLSWMGDLIPRRIRGRFFAKRNIVTQVIKIPFAMILAIYLGAVTVSGEITASNQPVLLWSLCGVFAIAAICGMIDSLIFNKVREVIPKRGSEKGRVAVDIDRRGLDEGRWRYLWRYIIAWFDQWIVKPLQNDKLFRKYVLYTGLITFSATLSGQYVLRNCLENLHLGFVGTDLIFMLISPLVAMVSARIWGKLLDSWGRKPVLILATVGVWFSVIPFFLASRLTPNPQFIVDAGNAIGGFAGSLVNAVGLGGSINTSGWSSALNGAPVGAWLIIAISIVFGAAGWTGVIMSQVNIMLGFADGKGRSRYLAVSAVLIGLFGFSGGLSGGILTSAFGYLRDCPIKFWLFEWNNWHVAFAASFLARVASIFWLFTMPDPSSRKTRDMVREMGMNFYISATNRLFYPLRVFGWRNHKN